MVKITNKAIKNWSKRRIVGMLLAVFALGLFALHYQNLKDGLLFFVLFLIAAFLKIPANNSMRDFALTGMWGCVCIIVNCVISNRMAMDGGYFFYLSRYCMVLNILCVAAVYGACLVITGRVKPAIVIASTMLAIVSTANGFVLPFRGTELAPMDFLSIRTAMNVAGQYAFVIRDGMAYGWLLWIWSLLMLDAFPSPNEVFSRKILRVLALVGTLICGEVTATRAKVMETFTWYAEGTLINGYFLNFTGLLMNSFTSAPDGYSESSIEELETEYVRGGGTLGEELPNIIVVMNEAYADFRVIGGELSTNIEVTPFMDSLTENTIRGYALTSVFGGTTANSEFECLTGLSMANLPTGSVPYQLYLKRETFSLAQLLKSYGYETMTTHPYYSSGWNRMEAYPSLGFSASTFLESYPQQELIREFVSDREMYSYVIERMEAQGEEPTFLFAISMQNHGEYTYTGKNYTQTVSLEGYDGSYPMAEQYLTLLRESDDAAREFFTALEDSPRKTVVLFFGDHFPQVEEEFFQELHGGSFDTLSEQMLQYTVPFFVWANYDIPEQTVTCTSLNYLTRYLLEAAGLPLSPFHSFLKDMEEKIPAINARGYYSLEQGDFLKTEDAQGEEAQLLQKYAWLQYNSLFDTKNKSQLFFGQYLNGVA